MGGPADAEQEPDGQGQTQYDGDDGGFGTKTAAGQDFRTFDRGFQQGIPGVAAGYLVGENINAIWRFCTGVDLYPPHMFGHVIEPVIRLPKVLLYAGTTVLISVLSALYPALSAGLREPLEALRDE